MDSKYYRIIVSVASALAAFIVYLLTLAPTVWFIDSGELAAVASTLGIAHPTGYPLFTIVGFLFSKLPISSSEVYNLNVMSAFFCALGVLVFYYAIGYMFTKNESSKQAEKQKKQTQKREDKQKTGTERTDFVTLYVIPATAALVLAFSRTYWGTANSVEVYPIHVFFLPLLILVFLKAIFSKSDSGVNTTFISQNKYYLLFALLLGLSFTNHLTTILLAPACLTLFFYTNFMDKNRMWKLLGWMTVCFLIGFSLYIYLPIRANMQPQFLWGNPFNLERFKWHITGKQFSVWIFSAKGSLPAFVLLIFAAVALSVTGLVKAKQMKQYWHFVFFLVIAILGYIVINSSDKIVVQQFNKFTGSLWIEFGTGIILLALIGVYSLSSSHITIYYFTVLNFFGCLFYSVNYDINDIYSYFLLAYLTIAVWIAFGILYVYRSIRSYTHLLAGKTLFAVAAALLLILPLSINYTYNDESRNYYVEEFTMNIFRNAEPNSIIISSQWDFWVSASWYFSYVKKIRPDLVIIDKELLRRSWYYIFLQRHYPEIYSNSKPEIDRFLIELEKFEHDIPYDQRTIVKAFEDMLTSFVTKNSGRRVYTTWEIEQNKEEKFARDYGRIPDGLLFRLISPENIKNNKIPEYKIYDFKFTPVKKSDYYHETLMTSYAMMLTSSAAYMVSQNKVEDAKKYISLALTAKPDFQQAIELKRKYGL